MCLITFGEMPSEEKLKGAEDNNPHGIGVAWNTKQGVKYRKNVSVKYLLGLPAEVKASCALHFRLATVGGCDPQLTHPYPISESVSLGDKGIAKAILMHNGHISDHETIARAIRGRSLRGPISDSRIVARLVHDYGRSILHLIRGQRFLYVAPGKVTLYGGGWEQVGATWYSNDSYKRARIIDAEYNYKGFTYTASDNKGDDDKRWNQVLNAWDKYDREQRKQVERFMLRDAYSCVDDTETEN